MVYLRDCVPDLINALRAAHQHDEPSSPLPDAKTLGSLLDVAFGASMEPEEGRFATFGLGLIPARGPKAPYKEVRFTRPRELCTTEVVKLAAGTDSITTSLAVWPEPERGPAHLGAHHVGESGRGKRTSTRTSDLPSSRAISGGESPRAGGSVCVLQAAAAPPLRPRDGPLSFVIRTATGDPARRRTSAASGCERAQPNRDQNFASRTRRNAVADGSGSRGLNRFAGRLVPLRPAEPRPSGRRSRPYRQCRR